MLGKDFFPPVLLDQFEFIVCVVAVIKDCGTSDVKVAEARCKRFVVRHFQDGMIRGLLESELKVE